MNTINNKDAMILVIDVQEKLSAMLNDDSIKDNALKIVKAGSILNLPIVITEQYPKGLGSTVQEIKNAVPNAKYVEKTSFSAFKEVSIKESLTKRQIILFGIETHICVLQTAFDLLNAGFEVFIVQNACGSRCEENKQAALRRLIHAKAQITTTEMVLFELLENSKHPNFKEIQALIK